MIKFYENQYLNKQLNRPNLKKDLLSDFNKHFKKIYVDRNDWQFDKSFKLLDNILENVFNDNNLINHHLLEFAVRTTFDLLNNL